MFLKKFIDIQLTDNKNFKKGDVRIKYIPSMSEGKLDNFMNWLNKIRND